MTDSKYFTTTKKGEIFELKSELNNDKKEKKKEAVKKVILVTKLTRLNASSYKHFLYSLGHRQHDRWKGCVCTISRRCQLHANRQFGTEEIGLFVSDELC